ncbi:EAL domain-containing protein, partial [Citrobacter braakii]
SLAYLTTLPIDELKIDRSFIRDLGVTPQRAAVVGAIVALARTLSLRVVAEGVDTLGQLEALLDLGCDSAQGYLMARPMAAEALQAWVAGLAA